MRDFLQKEIAVYVYKNNLQIISQKSLAEIHALKYRAPFFGSTDLIVEGFFNRLQAGYNVNTVPTVMRLTSKLQGTPEAQENGLCPLCLGVRDEVTNLLEIGSPITKIEYGANGEQKVTRLETSDDWFKTTIEKKLCFGCKRLFIEAKDKNKLIACLPEFIQ